MTTLFEHVSYFNYMLKQLCSRKLLKSKFGSRWFLIEREGERASERENSELYLNTGFYQFTLVFIKAV